MVVFVVLLLGALYLHPALLLLLLPCIMFFGWLAGYRQYRALKELEAWERRDHPLLVDQEKPWLM